jgi:adenine phosphoribosyltransferase
VDDLLATGGTCRAAIDLVERAGGVVTGAAFLVEIGFLNGRQRLDGYEARSVLRL